MPCGTGRFWALLAESPDREIHVCDNSQDMLDTGLKFQPKEVVARITSSFQGSAFDLPVNDNFAENIFCIRLIHHIGEANDRLKLLSELHRATSSTVIISLWLDGNYKARRRKKLEATRETGYYQNRFVIPTTTIEDEFKQSGFHIEERLDFIPLFSMWRTYVLKKI